MENNSAEYKVWTEAGTIFFQGTMRLSGTDAYAPINASMDEVLATKPETITLDLTNLEFLNSSGINLLAKFTIKVRSHPATAIQVKGSERIPWQSKSLPNLKKLHPGLQLIIA